MWCNQRYRFFSRKRLGGTHSLTLGIFFLRFGKKLAVFFFPGIVCTPLTQQRKLNLQKKVKNGQKWHPCRNSFLFVVFFSGQKLFFSPGKVYPSLTDSISEGGKKKTSVGVNFLSLFPKGEFLKNSPWGSH